MLSGTQITQTHTSDSNLMDIEEDFPLKGSLFETLPRELLQETINMVPVLYHVGNLSIVRAFGTYCKKLNFKKPSYQEAIASCETPEDAISFLNEDFLCDRFSFTDFLHICGFHPELRKALEESNKLHPHEIAILNHSKNYAPDLGNSLTERLKILKQVEENPQHLDQLIVYKLGRLGMDHFYVARQIMTNPSLLEKVIGADNMGEWCDITMGLPIHDFNRQNMLFELAKKTAIELAQRKKSSEDLNATDITCLPRVMGRS